jgi:hypothetical protein
MLSHRLDEMRANPSRAAKNQDSALLNWDPVAIPAV